MSEKRRLNLPTIAGILLIIIGGMLIGGDYLSALITSFPFVEEGYWMEGEILCDGSYTITGEEGKFDLWVCPYSEKGVEIDYVHVIWKPMYIESWLDFYDVIERPEYDWYQYRSTFQVGATNTNLQLQYNTRYDITYIIRDVKGREFKIDTWVMLIPPEGVSPEPEPSVSGYVTVNGRRVTQEDKVILSTRNLDIRFYPDDMSKVVSVQGTLDGQELTFTNQGTFYQCLYTLPEDGTYELKVNVNDVEFASFSIVSASGVINVEKALSGLLLIFAGSICIVKGEKRSE